MKSPVQRAYDDAARAYADRLFGELAHEPFDRAMLDRIAGQVGDARLICDMGCGPGQIARYLKDRGALTVGIDLSAGMIESARRLNPDIEFSWAICASATLSSTPPLRELSPRVDSSKDAAFVGTSLIPLSF